MNRADSTTAVQQTRERSVQSMERTVEISRKANPESKGPWKNLKNLEFQCRDSKFQSMQLTLH